MVLHKYARRSTVFAAVCLMMLMAPLPEVGFVTTSVSASEDLPEPVEATAEQNVEAQAAADEPIGDQRVQAARSGTDEFALIAVVFDREPSAPVMLRVRTTAGQWDTWTELHLDDAEGPDETGTAERSANWGTEPFWVASADGYELNLAPQDADAARVVLVRDETRRVVTMTESVAGAENAPFGINNRGAWGARPARAVNYGSTIKKAVVHHTVNSNGYSQAQVPGMLRGIQAYHMDGRGWDDIGYNFVVDRFGGIWEGRQGGIDRPVVGAHASGFNTNTVGISILGDFTSAQPPAAAIEGVSRVAGWKLYLGKVDPTGSGTYTSGGSPRYPAGTVVNIPNVVGHGDVGQTGCPGRTSELLPQIRQRAQEWKDWSQALSSPLGMLESVSTSGGAVTATGWAGEYAVDGPTTVRVGTAGKTVRATTNIARPDVVAAYPGLLPNTGFSITVPNVGPGFKDVCAAALSSRGAEELFLGCRSVRVADPSGKSPDGRIDTTGAHPGRLQVGGWAKDPDASGPSNTVLIVDGVARASVSTVNGRFWYNLHGIAEGARRVCIEVRNRGAGQNVWIDCTNVNVPGASPIGAYDTITNSRNRVTVAGWALDPGVTGAARVRLAVNGWALGLVNADRPRPDVGKTYFGAGDAHGWEWEVTLPNGSHTVCATALNQGAGADTPLGCRQIIAK
ncbi:MAG: peptidoglycan recognition protein [Microthrixaceae bacterium]